METRYKYRIIKGEQDPYADILHEGSIDKHFTGMPIGFNGKSYKIVDMPTKNAKDDFWVVNLEQVSAP